MGPCARLMEQCGQSLAQSIRRVSALIDPRTMSSLRVPCSLMRPRLVRPVVGVVVTQPFSEPPALVVAFTAEARRYSLSLRLPVVASSFMDASQASDASFWEMARGTPSSPPPTKRAFGLPVELVGTGVYRHETDRGVRSVWFLP